MLYCVLHYCVWRGPDSDYWDLTVWLPQEEQLEWGRAGPGWARLEHRHQQSQIYTNWHPASSCQHRPASPLEENYLSPQYKLLSPSLTLIHNPVSLVWCLSRNRLSRHRAGAARPRLWRVNSLDSHDSGIFSAQLTCSQDGLKAQGDSGRDQPGTRGQTNH